MANFCFPEQVAAKGIAAVDFQYVGKGVGIKDLVYFLGSCLDQFELEEHASILLEEYFSFMAQGISEYQIEVDFVTLEQEWRSLYPLAWADFHRFLTGWSPEHAKINGYMQAQTELALRVIE